MQCTQFDGYTDTLSKQSQNATRIFTDFLKCWMRCNKTMHGKLVWIVITIKLLFMLSNFYYDEIGYVANS